MNRRMDQEVTWARTLRTGLCIVATGLILFVACSNDELEVAEAQPCATPGVDLVAHFKPDVTDEQISDLAESLSDFSDANNIPEHVRIVSDSSADYEARALRFNFCEGTTTAAISRFRDRLMRSMLIARFEPAQVTDGD